MNAVFLHKRNESLNRMWACLAGAEAAVWTLSSGLANSSRFLCIFLCIAVVVLGLAAPFHYLAACDRYMKAKGSSKAFSIAGAVLILAVVASIVMSIVTCSSTLVAYYFVVPVTFALSALPLKLIPDRG